jgi:hypothetical protein
MEDENRVPEVSLFSFSNYFCTFTGMQWYKTDLPHFPYEYLLPMHIKKKLKNLPEENKEFSIPWNTVFLKKHLL